MAYTLKQLTIAWTATHDGIAPDAATTASLTSLVNQGFSDAKSLSAVLNDADSTTSVAVMIYQFFTGKSPTKAGLDYLVNSAGNPTDLNDPYYAKFNLENRFMNFASNLAIHGEGATAFASKYGAMSYADFVASIYETIVGASLAKAAGLDPAASIASIIASKDGIQVAATSAGMITANSTPQQIDLALKTATAAYLLLEGIKADVGVYASATNNFMLALATGTAVYNTDITATYASYRGAGSEGTGHAVDNAPMLPGGDPPPEPPPPRSLILTLTTGQDELTGDDVNDAFNGTHLTFTPNDILSGLGGRDSFNLTAATGGVYTVPTASIAGIETANLSNNGGLVVDTFDWTGLTQLNVTSAGYTDISSDVTTDVTATVSNLDLDDVSIIAARDVTLTVTGATEGFINVAAVGDINVSREVVGGVAAGEITIIGGVNVDVTLTSTLPAAGDIQDLGAVLVAGYLDTQAVKITAPKSLADDGVHGEIIAPTVAIQDFYYGSGLYQGTIKTVEVDGFGGAGFAFAGSGLTTLTLSHGAGVYIDNSDGLTVADATVLNVALNDVQGLFDDEGAYETLNITQGVEASDIDLGMDGLKTLTLAGVGKLSLIADPGFSPNIETVTVSGAASLDVDLSGQTHLTSVDASGTTGDVTVTIDVSVTAYTGGAGMDDVTFSSVDVTQAVSLGDGDDRVTLATGTNIPTVTVTGGLGTDTLAMDADTAANTPAIVNQFTGFERVDLSSTSYHVIDLGNLGFHYATVWGAIGLQLNGMNSGDTVVLNRQGQAYSLNPAAGANTASDTLNLVLEDSAGAGVYFSNAFAPGFEHLNITTHDGSAAPAGAMERLYLTSAIETIVVSGNAGLDVTSGISSNLTSIDASGITEGGLKLDMFGPPPAITIKGSATQDNTIVLTHIPTSVVTYVAGTADNSVSGWATGNHLSFAETNNAVVMGSKITGPGTLAGLLAAAAQDVAGTTNTLHWFEFGGDTYIVSDISDATAFVDGADTLVKLVGRAGSLDPSIATVAGGMITFH